VLLGAVINPLLWRIPCAPFTPPLSASRSQPSSSAAEPPPRATVAPRTPIATAIGFCDAGECIDYDDDDDDDDGGDGGRDNGDQGGGGSSGDDEPVDDASLDAVGQWLSLARMEGADWMILWNLCPNESLSGGEIVGVFDTDEWEWLDIYGGALHTGTYSPDTNSVTVDYEWEDVDTSNRGAVNLTLTYDADDDVLLTQGGLHFYRVATDTTNADCN
jgi:hypothetical protein